MDNICVRFGGVCGINGNSRKVRYKADGFDGGDGDKNDSCSNILMDNGVYCRLTVGDREHLGALVDVSRFVRLGNVSVVVVLFQSTSTGEHQQGSPDRQVRGIDDTSGVHYSP